MHASFNKHYKVSLYFKSTSPSLLPKATRQSSWNLLLTLFLRRNNGTLTLSWKITWMLKLTRRPWVGCSIDIDKGHQHRSRRSYLKDFRPPAKNWLPWLLANMLNRWVWNFAPSELWFHVPFRLNVADLMFIDLVHESSSEELLEELQNLVQRQKSKTLISESLSRAVELELHMSAII